MLKVLLFTGEALLNGFSFMLQWPDRPAGSKFISGLALFKVKKLHLRYILIYLVELLLVTWEAGQPCICYRIGFHVAAVGVQVLVLFLNRFFRNLGLYISLVVSCHILIVCLFIIYSVSIFFI